MPMVRDRAVGHETSLAVDSPDGGLQISVETEMAFGEVGLRQSVVATYDEMLRPERCYVDATINSRTMQIEVVIGNRDAVVRVCGDAGDEERTIPLCGRPLLLIDNCFTLHALAAWSIVCGISSERDDPEAAVHTALPAGRDLRTSRRRLERVSLGGVDLGRPSVTLHLGPDLDEHAWFVDNRLQRLAIPRLHVRVDRIDDWTLNGDEECTKR
jgi:hypothetical protein